MQSIHMPLLWTRGHGLEGQKGVQHASFCKVVERFAPPDIFNNAIASKHTSTPGTALISITLLTQIGQDLQLLTDQTNTANSWPTLQKSAERSRFGRKKRRSVETEDADKTAIFF